MAVTQQTGSTDAPAPAAAALGPTARSVLGELRPVWSWPACLRAARATVVVPGVMALTFVVIGNLQMALFAVFGGFGSLVMASFAGSRRDRAVAHGLLALAGAGAITLGTLVGGATWLAIVVTLPVAFAVSFAGVASPNAASGVLAVLLVYVLPVASSGGLPTLGWRLAGWGLASAASAIAVQLVWPHQASNRLRTAAAACATTLADQVERALRGETTAADREAVARAERELMALFESTPYRPVGLAAADQGLSSAVHVLEWCAALVYDATDPGVGLARAAAQDRRVLERSAEALRTAAALLGGAAARPDFEGLWHARTISAARLRRLEGDPQTLRHQAAQAFHAQVIGVATASAMADALVAARRATHREVAVLRRRWLAGRPDDATATGRRRRLPTWVATAVGSDASSRSVWFRNSARCAVALAIAVTLARLVDVQHSFWVVLGTLSVLRTSASATGATALRALAGTVVGFVIGTALLVGIGDSSAALWAALPLAVLVASYAPGAAPFLVGQAAFTITVVVLFNLLVPAGWRVGLVRVEDVAIGCAVSLLVGLLCWPRGGSSLVGDNLADAYRCGAAYLTGAVRWALGGGPKGPLHERAVTAVSSGSRLDDALRTYLTEQGSHRLAKDDLWVLATAAQRLRLTSHSLAMLPSAVPDGTGPAGAAPGHVTPSVDTAGSRFDGAAAGGAAAGGDHHTALEDQAAEIAGFYDRLATQVDRPGHGGGPAAELAPPHDHPGRPVARGGTGDLSAADRAEALWVGAHVEQLALHAASLTGPAARLAAVRQRPWWR